jgi:hypothetical protein
MLRGAAVGVGGWGDCSDGLYSTAGRGAVAHEVVRGRPMVYLAWCSFLPARVPVVLFCEAVTAVV